MHLTYAAMNTYIYTEIQMDAVSMGHSRPDELLGGVLALSSIR
jgi:hypothetical protein